MDSICLNQDDVLEKSIQVHGMWLIFAGASKVFAWLNIPQKSPRLNFAHEQKMTAGDLLDNEYFNRTWILPEILQAREVELIFGRYNCDFPFISRLPATDKTEEWKAFGKPGESHAHRLLHAWGKVSNMYLVDRTELFMTTLSDYGQTECSDPRDRIFAMISDPRVQSLGLRAALKPDYRLRADEVALLVFAAFDAVCEPMGLESFRDREEEWREAIRENIRLALAVFTASSLSCSWFPVASLAALRQTLLPLLETRDGTTFMRSTREEVNTSGPTMTCLLLSDRIPKREFFYDTSDLEPGKPFFIDCLERIVGRNPDLPTSEANCRPANRQPLRTPDRQSSSSMSSDSSSDVNEEDPWATAVSWTSAVPRVRAKRQQLQDSAIEPELA